MTTGPIKVLYIAGSGRSGTTLMARLFGEMSGFVNVGEAARYLFDATVRATGIPCGCGARVEACPFWKNIDALIPPELPVLGTNLTRMRRFPTLVGRNGSAAVSAEDQRFLATIGAVYRRIAQDSGCEVIVDSSKNPANGVLLHLVPDIELHVVHMVRKPQSVVSSWTKSKGYLPAHPVGKVIVWWWSYNVLSEWLGKHARSYQRVLYEDFVRDPGATLRETSARITGREVPTPFLQGPRATVHAQHGLAGNPDKLKAGELVIGDQRKPTPAPFAQRLLVGLLTFPLSIRYYAGGTKTKERVQGESKKA